MAVWRRSRYASEPVDMTTFDPKKHPRWPPGSGKKSGQFMTTADIKAHPDIAKRARASKPATKGGAKGKPGKGYHKFRGGEDADQWGENAFQDWRDGLSPEERKALRDYGQEAHAEVNGALRSGGTPSTDVASDIANLDSALRRAVVPEDVAVYRRMSSPELTALFHSFDFQGAQIQDDGFTSTTADKDILGELDLEHLQGDHDFMTNLPIVAQINVPAGTNGAYLGSLSSAPEEQELLLARGTTFEVRGAILGPDDVLQMVLDVVPPEEASAQGPSGNEMAIAR